MKWLTFVSILILFACSNSKKAVEVKTAADQQELFSSEKVTLTFERTVCFGTCPAFKITIMNDGQCFYEGYKFVELEGTYTSSIEKDQMDEIFKEAQRIGFYDLDDRYDNEAVTDVPSTTVELAGPNGIKKIYDRYEAPQELRDFEKYLDGVLLKLNWTKTELPSKD